MPNPLSVPSVSPCRTPRGTTTQTRRSPRTPQPPHTIPDPERGGLSRRVPPSPPQGHRRIPPQTNPLTAPRFPRRQSTPQIPLARLAPCHVRTAIENIPLTRNKP